MRIAGFAASVAMSALSLLLPSAPALAQADCKSVVAPSPFGPDDQTGATNRITPAVTKAAAAEIQTGVVTPMAYNLVDGVPLFGTRFTKTILTSCRHRARRRVRQEQAELHGGHLSQPEPCRHAYRRHGPHRHPGLLLQPDADGEIRHPELPEAARPREHQDLRHARRHHRRGEGVPGGRQAEDQRRVQERPASTAAR